MKTNTQTFDRSLVRAIKLGDHHAFRQLFDKYRDLLYGYSLKMTKSKPLAEEAVQEVFMKVWQNRKLLVENLSIKAYLFKITQNLVFNALRKAAYSEKLKQQVFYQAQALHYDTEDQVVYRDLQKFKKLAVDNLPASRKMIFQMSREQGLSHAEIALELNISKNTVKDQISKALKSIKKQLKLHADVVASVLLLMLYSL